MRMRLAVLMLLGVATAAGQAVDATTLQGKVLMGYQGWFRCPGGGPLGSNWSHWAGGTPTAATLQIDMYPDLREFDLDELCVVPNMTIGAEPARLFSSGSSKTVDRHFRWMQQYGLDGVLLQRFVTDIRGNRAGGDVVLKNVMAAARSAGRVFAIEYDISGANAATVDADLRADWRYLVETLGVTAHPGYLHHEGKAVVGVWGIGLNDTRHPPSDPAAALRLIEWFRNEANVFYLGGTPAYWRGLSNDAATDRRWTDVYRAMDGIQPWTVGRYNNLAGVDRWRTTQIQPDLAATAGTKQVYMPVIFPGFSWYNLNRTAVQNQIPRNRGEFLWRQAFNARAAGAETLKIAMFDEVNEATSIFKVAPKRENAPDQGYWLTLDADGFTLPSDWYLRLAAEIAKGFREAKPLAVGLPTSPGPWGELAIVLERQTLAPESIGVATGMPAALESLVVIDSTGMARTATVLSEGRFLAPSGLANGDAVLVATGTDGGVTYGNVAVGSVAPALYQGSVTGRMVELYGTGIRGRSSLAAVTCTIGGVPVSVVYAGPQGGYPGLDQVNLELPASFSTTGLSTVVLTVDGVNAAPISITIL
ncbi:MAG: hypothetical protein NTV52_04210 [Acidobacteria bacterium]|nr:hypothetical protein [Acidobacteriota bacterium]